MNRIERIQNLLTAYSPLHHKITDESHLHHVPQHLETHVNILLVSNTFQCMRLIARHRLINHLLADEFKRGLHALTLHLYTPEEWAKQQHARPSPPCLDGFDSTDADI